MSRINTLLSTETPLRPLGYLPTWWEGESLYGWCSRLHALRGDKTRQLGSVLFGREHACRVVDIPSGMGRWVHVTEGKLGTAEEVIRRRTVAAAYWPFASDPTRRLLIQAATDAAGVPIPMVLGLPAGRIGASHPLRSCPECRREMVATRGYATWLLEDQLPGVWWCNVHRRTLEQVCSGKAVWRKPGDEATAFGEPIGADEKHALAMMRALAQTIVSEDRINPWGLASAIIGRLKSLAIATSTARLNVQRINGWLADAPIFQWMSRQGSMVGVPANNWAVPMIRGRSRSHPLKWMLLWTNAWRSEGVDEAVAAFQLAARGLATHENGTQFLLWPDDWGHPTDTGVPAEVEEAFLSCQTIQEVAMALSSSTGAVKKLLTDYPRFGRVWMRNVREQRIRRARENMHRELAANPSVTRSELQRRCKTDVEWLSRNAPITLRSILARLPARKGPQGELF